jgi:dCTP diphosphatase
MKIFSREGKILNDTVTCIQQLKDLVAGFVRDRNWEQFHTPKNLAMSIAIEAAELMEIFQWRQENGVEPEDAGRIQEELADVVIYSLTMANRMKIDLSSIIVDKIEKNSRKYPRDRYYGKYK